jgi:amino acid transporter
MLLWYGLTAFFLLGFLYDYEYTRALCNTERLSLLQRMTVCNVGRDIYTIHMLIGLVLLLPFYLTVEEFTKEEKKRGVIPERARPSLISYLLLFVTFSYGLWFGTSTSGLLLLYFLLLTSVNDILSKKYKDMLKRHYISMLICFIISILIIIFFTLIGGPPALLWRDPLTAALLLLYFIVSSAEIKRNRYTYPFP